MFEALDKTDCPKNTVRFLSGLRKLNELHLIWYFLFIWNLMTRKQKIRSERSVWHQCKNSFTFWNTIELKRKDLNTQTSKATFWSDEPQLKSVVSLSHVNYVKLFYLHWLTISTVAALFAVSESQQGNIWLARPKKQSMYLMMEKPWAPGAGSIPMHLLFSLAPCCSYTCSSGSLFLSSSLTLLSSLHLPFTQTLLSTLSCLVSGQCSALCHHLRPLTCLCRCETCLSCWFGSPRSPGSDAPHNAAWLQYLYGSIQCC